MYTRALSSYNQYTSVGFPLALQTARFESEVSEAENAAKESKKRLDEALLQAKAATADAEAARVFAAEAQVGDDQSG